MKRVVAIIIAFVIAFGLPYNARCCEPILPLAQLLAGSSLVGPALLMRSLFWLLAAVIIKTGAFVLLERRLSWRRAILYMLFANVISTIPGFLIAGISASLSAAWLALPLVGLLGWAVQRRVARLSGSSLWRRVSAVTVVICFVAFFYISLAVYGFAEGALYGDDFVGYWIMKFVFVAMVACTGMVISSVLEECVVAGLARKSQGNVSFYAPVLRANYFTLALVLLVAALEMLPRRLHAPHFIVSWLHSVATSFGLA